MSSRTSATTKMAHLDRDCPGDSAMLGPMTACGLLESRIYIELKRGKFVGECQDAQHARLSGNVSIRIEEGDRKWKR
jgi:hypothetical protein